MANEFLDQFIRHQGFIQRLASSEANNFDDFIKRADKIIRDILNAQGDTISSKRVMNQVIKQLSEELSPVYDEFSELLISNLEEIAVNESQWTVGAMMDGVEGELRTPSSTQVIAAAFSRPMTTGQTEELLRPFMRTFSSFQTKKVQNAIRTGFFEGQTISDMVRAIRGTREQKFKDGILATTTRSAKIITRTAVNHISNEAKNQVYNANSRFLEGVEWSSVLDNRTSSICRIRDGIVYPVDSGPRPPAHPSCRSQIIPKVKSEFTLFRGNETRASKGADGPKPTQATNYYTWLRTQPAAFQDEILGTTKGKIFRNAGLDTDEFRKLVSNSFDEPLTIAQMRAKEPEIFARVGL